MQPNDPLYSSQWHFTLIGDIETIWDDYTGEGIAVGVYDEGVESAHPDLDDNYDSALLFPGDDGEPNGAANGHGTAVAGIIAAENNGVGVVGVAFDATVTGVDLLQDLNSAQTLDAYDWMANFDITNHSWGYTPTFGSDNDVGDSSGYTYQEAEHFGVAAASGRGGLGTVNFKAAGNENHNSSLEASGIMGNAQGDGMNNTRFAVTVAATGAGGIVADYSNWGTNVLIAAPAAQYTTDMTSFFGYSGTDYANDFGGTSAATPVVAGVAALMMEANAGLGWRDVQEILSVSAAHTGSSYGAAATSYEEGAWFANGADDWNGGGRTFNVSYGFGMVDAFAAVRMAEVWSQFGAAQTSANEMSGTLEYSGAAVSILDNDTVSISQAASLGMVVEHIDARITVSHTYMSDIQMTLVGPDGTRYVLLNHDGSSDFLAGSYTYGVDVVRGSYSDGTWTVEVEDTASGDTGTLSDFTLDFYGSVVSDDKVFHFTEDYLTYRADEISRASTVVATGGVQWLNLAAITGDVAFVAAGTAGFSVDGAVWATYDGAGRIEHFVTGDGNDTVQGNWLANQMLGMRGDDLLNGAAGNDTLEGGLGNDTLNGDKGRDRLIGGEGHDDLRSGDDNDTSVGGNGNDTLRAGAGDDLAWLNDGADVFYDQDESGGLGHDTIYGGTGNDSLEGASGNDKFYGEAGADTLSGGTGNDTLFGGSGDDFLSGEEGNDRLNGGADNDTLVGHDGNDVLIGENGNDRFYAGYGDDTIYGGNGNDTVFGHQGNDYVEMGFGDDLFNDTDGSTGGNDTVYAGMGRDTIYGSTGADFFYGGGDPDFINGGLDNDLLVGGTGWDTLRGEGGNDSIVGDEGNDRLYGGYGEDLVFGMLGNDFLHGSNGNDSLVGGDGDDRYFGGLDADTFVFESGNDVITDFDASEDIMAIISAPWGGVTLTGQQVVDTYGGYVTEGYELYFNAATSIVFEGMVDNTGLAAAIDFSY